MEGRVCEKGVNGGCRGQAGENGEGGTGAREGGIRRGIGSRMAGGAGGTRKRYIQYMEVQGLRHSRTPGPAMVRCPAAQQRGSRTAAAQ